MTRENFRQTSPVHVRRSSLGSSSNTPETSLYNKLHEDPKVKAAQYSGVSSLLLFILGISNTLTFPFFSPTQYNRRVLQTSAIAFGDDADPTLSSEKGRSWNRVRAAVPGTSSFRFFHENQNATPSKVHKKSERKETFKYVFYLTHFFAKNYILTSLPDPRYPRRRI